MMTTCEFCGRDGDGARPICRNLADMRGWAEQGDAICDAKLKERLAEWQRTESGLSIFRISVAA